MKRFMNEVTWAMCSKCTDFNAMSCHIKKRAAGVLTYLLQNVFFAEIYEREYENDTDAIRILAQLVPLNGLFTGHCSL